jgi:hypothetical protein
MHISNGYVYIKLGGHYPPIEINKRLIMPLVSLQVPEMAQLFLIAWLSINCC